MKDALHDAASKKNGYALVRVLIEENDADINALHSEHNTRAVAFAAQSGSLDTLKYFVELVDADLDASQSEFNLLYWASFNTPEVMAYVTNRETSLFRRFNDGTTELHVAAMSGDLKWIEEILNRAPKSITQTDIRGHNPLYYAALLGKKDVVGFITNHPVFFMLSEPDLADMFDAMERGFGNHSFWSIKDVFQSCNAAIIHYKAIHKKRECDYVLAAKSYYDLAVVYSEINSLTEAKTACENVIECYKRVDDKNDMKKRFLIPAQHKLTWIERRLSLIREAKKWGFEYRNIAADGNCFFSAIHDQFKLLIPEYAHLTHADLRAQTVAHMREYALDYQDFVMQNETHYSSKDAFAEYLSTMSKDCTWADHFATVALARAFNVTIVLLRSDGAAPTVISRRPQPKCVVYLGFEPELHYGSLSCKDLSLAMPLDAEIHRVDYDEFNKPVLPIITTPAAASSKFEPPIEALNSLGIFADQISPWDKALQEAVSLCSISVDVRTPSAK